MQTVRTMRQARTRVTPRSAQATSGDPLRGGDQLTGTSSNNVLELVLDVTALQTTARQRFSSSTMTRCSGVLSAPF
jgi:hypothetical protein